MEACFYSDKFHQAEVLQQPSLSWMVCLIWWSYLLRAHCEATLSPSQDISHFSNLIILKYLKEHLAWKKAWELATALPLKNPAMYFRDCSDKKMQSWDFLNIQVLASFWFLSWLLFNWQDLWEWVWDHSCRFLLLEMSEEYCLGAHVMQKP